MRRPLFAFLFSLLWLLASTASAAAATERGALFKVSLDGHEMHLFGTLHVGLPEFYPLEPRIAEALGQASTLALELDPAQPQRELLRAVREHGMLDPGAAGYDAMEAQQRALLDKLIEQGRLDASRVMTFKPVLLATLLTLAEYTKQGYRTDLSSEAWLVRQARAQGARVLELESLDRQLSLLDRLAEPDRWRFLDEMMAAIVSGAQRREARNMVQAWRSADREALDAIAARCELDASVSGSFVNRVLLKERNAGLANSLLDLLRREPKTFAAVGVLHLLGSESVPKLLQEKGVQVERIY
ncbi:TraB/GumN family protein [Massilia aerilata]|uniref:TraB/GumN family protein n=1 Tax=Massilia aerilata TaxID=453817 RepID=A0ABW0S7L8_9BURK